MAKRARRMKEKEENNQVENKTQEEVKTKTERKSRSPRGKKPVIILLLLLIIIASTLVLLEYTVDLSTHVREFMEEHITPIFSSNEFTREQAIEMAVEEFEARGERNLDHRTLDLEEITRGDDRFYFISSDYNSIEIEAETGRVHRINNVRQ